MERKYRKMEKLGQGTYGVVYKAEQLTGPNQGKTARGNSNSAHLAWLSRAATTNVVCFNHNGVGVGACCSYPRVLHTVAVLIWVVIVPTYNHRPADTPNEEPKVVHWNLLKIAVGVSAMCHGMCREDCGTQPA